MKQFLSLTLAVAIYAVAPVHAADQNVQLLEKAQSYKSEVTDLIKQMVNIDSGTGDEAGVDKVGAIAIKELTKLGAKIETRSSAPAVGKNILATFTGSGRGRILLIAHMDTVFGPGTVATRPFTIKGDRAYGPGVMDDKGGIAMGIYVIRLLQETGFKNFGTISLVLNTNEETGSTGTRTLIEELAKAHDVAFNLEPGRAADGLVVWRKGSGLISVEVEGKSAHAGVEPEKGRNAAIELAHQALAINKLGDPATKTTVNFTVMKSGDRYNVIPDRAQGRADIRVMTVSEFDRVEKALNALSAQPSITDTKVNIKLDRNFPPMAINSGTDALAEKAQAVYSELGRKLTLEGSGGAADVNFVAGVGTRALDGLGIVGGGIHTADEYAELNSIAPRLYLLGRLIMEYGPGH